MSGRRSNYLPALDGLRAIAILLVIGYHAGISAMRGGFLGVDLFFLLSGYLITSLVALEYDKHGAVSLFNFYMRRVLRLFPALLLLLLLFIPLSFYWGGENVGFAHLEESLVALLYFSNWSRAFQLFHTDYLGHTWSLAIEWQFYLLWPPLLYAFLKRIKTRRKVAWIALLIALLSWGWRLFLTLNGEAAERIYNGLDCRIDGLLLGASIALFLSDRPTRDSWSAAVRQRSHSFYLIAAALFLLAFLNGEWDGSSTFVLYLVLAELSAAVLIVVILLGEQELWWIRVISWPPLVLVGAISYGIYLWHYPIYRLFVDLGWGSGRYLIGIAFPISALIAYLSWRFLERPVLRLKSHFRTK